MFDARNRLAVDVSAQLLQHFGPLVFQTIIPRNIRLAEAPSHGLPVHLYDRGSRGAAAYAAFASEWLRRYALDQHNRMPAKTAELVMEQTVAEGEWS